MGRPPIPIEPHIEKLVQAILLGATYEMAAMYAGISYKTFQRWRQQADKARAGTPLARLRDRLLEAEGRAAIGWLAKIEKAANDGDWRAAAFKLKARWPGAFGDRLQADLTVQVHQAVQSVADELGIDAQLVLREAQAYLLETKRADPP